MQIYGLVGRTLGHSFSKGFFTEFFNSHGIDAVYRNFEMAEVSEFPKLIADIPELRGVNVTIPYKREIISFLDSLSDVALAVGAVNVVGIRLKNGDIRLCGHNTDAEGFRKSIEPMLAGGKHKRALILGTGGASAAVEYALRTLGIEPLKVSRISGRGGLTYAELDAEVMGAHTIIVNATPVGTYPDTDAAPPIPYRLVTERHICHDLVYNPADTKFMRLSRERGAKVKNGLEMLHEQARAAWEFWQKS